MTTRADIEQHPDLAELRSRFERATITPVAQAVEALALLTGVYLAASPWIAGFSGLTALAATNLIVGIAYAACMGGFASAYERTHAMAWAGSVLGAFTILAPWLVAGDVATTATIVNNVIVGAVALLCAVAMAAGAQRRGGRGTGPSAMS